MPRIEIGKYLAADSRVCGGRLIFKGSRIKVADVLELAEDGYSPEEISKQYRGIITPEAVIEALSLIRQGFLKEMTVSGKVVKLSPRKVAWYEKGRTDRQYMIW